MRYFPDTKETVITLASAGSGVADLVARARREHTTFMVFDATTPVARLIPAESPRCTGAELARALAGVEFSTEEARAWAKDLRDLRAALSPPEDC